jgi:hypothetical protein
VPANTGLRPSQIDGLLAAIRRMPIREWARVMSRSFFLCASRGNYCEDLLVDLIRFQNTEMISIWDYDVPAAGNIRNKSIV